MNVTWRWIIALASICWLFASCSSDVSDTAKFYRREEELYAQVMYKVFEIADPVIDTYKSPSESFSPDDISDFVDYFSQKEVGNKIDELYEIFNQMEALQEEYQMPVPTLKREKPQLVIALDMLQAFDAKYVDFSDEDKAIVMNACISTLHSYSEKYHKDIKHIEDRLNNGFDYGKAVTKLA